MNRSLKIVLFLALLFAGCSDGKKDKTDYIKIGTGSQTGVYYTVGLAIANLVNQLKEQYHIDAAVESTAGSVFNINAVITGNLEIGIAQADRQYQAVHGLGSWKSNPQQKLAFICSLHSETVMFIAADDSGINSLQDLKGHVISIGAPGSGARDNALDILKELGLEMGRDYTAQGLEVTQASQMLQDGRIDGFFHTAGHPNGSITEGTNGGRKVHFVPITGIDRLISDNPYYVKTRIPVSLYSQVSNKEEVETIGMLTTLITSEEVSDEIVYVVTKAIFDHLETFKGEHPALKNLTREGMMQGQFAPLHPGAKRYFEEGVGS